MRWKEEYSVNVKEIDEQHKKFINLIDQLYVANKNFTMDKELGRILSELIDYAHTHFETEEKYFDKFKYSDSEEHKKIHRELTSKLEKFRKSFVASKEDISFELMDFLEDWLVDHLKTVDKKYTKCFNEHGLF